MRSVKPKKYLGQHFLRDQNISEKITGSLTGHGNYNTLIEIGPGTGVLTDFLLKKNYQSLILIELDYESIVLLKDKYGDSNVNIVHGNVLKMDMDFTENGPMGMIGNFPYNISSQIFFKILEHKHRITEVVCMLQKEVAERMCAMHGNKTYGILSVLIGAFYDRELLFNVPPHVFFPPPKVESSVIRLKRNNVQQLPCDETMFRKIVKQGFQNRRKTLRNALKPINLPDELKEEFFLTQRAEQLSIQDFISLTQKAEEYWRM